MGSMRKVAQGPPGRTGSVRPNGGWPWHRSCGMLDRTRRSDTAMPPLDLAVRLAIAALGGAVVGLEREWSGHASGPTARFAGIRTFTLLGLTGGLAGLLHALDAPIAGSVLLAAAGALVVAAYVAASIYDVDGTTEVAAFVVLSAGALAGLGQLAVASGLAALTGLLLVEKSRLHALVARVDGADLRAGIRFAAMALVVLPLVPTGPYGPEPGLRPRELWMLVLFFSGLGFLGHVARRAVGPSRGLAVAGALGGVISSTNVTLTFARASREAPADARPLASGILAANLVLVPRVLVATAVLHPGLAAALAPRLLPAAALLAAVLLVSLRGHRDHDDGPSASSQPLRVGAALQMAVLFQLVLYAVHAAQAWFGDAGLLATAAALGLTDVDALTVTMARGVAPTSGVTLAAQAIAVGITANTLLKAGLAIALGRGACRAVAGTTLAATAAALAVTLWLA